MFLLWNRAPRVDRVARAVLKRLSKTLAKENSRQIKTLSCLTSDPGQLETLFGPLKTTAEVRAEIALARQKRCEGQAAQTVALLGHLSKAVRERLNAEPRENLHALQALSRTLVLLLAAQEALLPVTQRIAVLPRKRRVVISEDLLHEAYQLLFPAERMLVVAGQRMANTTRLARLFDVTGDQTGGHVRADAALLGRALIEMDQSESFLAAWVHSHPGVGPAATCPSSIDLRQHQDWIRDYSATLLSIIVVKDRWVRFWGTGLETGQIEVELLGHGLIKENIHGYIYRLDERRLPAEPTDAGAVHRDGDGATLTPEA